MEKKHGKKPTFNRSRSVYLQFGSVSVFCFVGGKQKFCTEHTHTQKSSRFEEKTHGSHHIYWWLDRTKRRTSCIEDLPVVPQLANQSRCRFLCFEWVGFFLQQTTHQIQVLTRDIWRIYGPNKMVRNCAEHKKRSFGRGAIDNTIHIWLSCI